MPDPSETGGRPLSSNIQQPEGITRPSTIRKRRRNSQSSDERVGGTKSTSSRRRPGSRNDVTFGPHTGSSRGDSSTMQQSASPSQMSPEMTSVNYTRTGRISKAKKGLKVHNCECGRSYTRAEHLRRHQKNHAQDALKCSWPECGKTFYRLDLLQRHQERHNEIGNQKDESPQQPFNSPGASTPLDQVQTSTTPAASIMNTSQPTTPYYQQGAISPLPEHSSDPRYTSTQFRTPRVPSSAFGPPLFRPLPSSNTTKRASYTSSQHRQQPSVTVPVDGLSSSIQWGDPFVTQSPNYSSSSGYASPVPVNDFANMFAHPPYATGSARTRTSSNASFIEPWGYPSRSPTSATSTLAFTWATDKSPAPASMPFLSTSGYNMPNIPMVTGHDQATGYMMYPGPKSMAQRDEEEQAFLFPEQSFGMGQITNTIPYEQYLDNYWRLFHPSFPIVHRASFGGVSDSPMLRAAMIAIGAQYSNDPSAKMKSRILHDRCMKILDTRDIDVITDGPRLCDNQALFLIEVLYQYRARRAAKNLSKRFEEMYQKLSHDYRMVNANIINTISGIGQAENSAFEHWTQWIQYSSQQRLLLACYILEYQQATLLARPAQASLIQVSGFDLPFPVPTVLWDATSAEEWAVAAGQYGHFPRNVYEATADVNFTPFDPFQSLLLIATTYNLFGNTTPYLSPASHLSIDHLLDQSPVTKHHLFTAKLLQAVPIRALLAVSGESWILSEKVPSIAAFASLKHTLKIWANGLWSNGTDAQSQAVKDALKFAIDLLQHALAPESQNLRLELGADMGLYFAALVIWAVTVTANTRINQPQSQGQSRYSSHSPHPSQRSSAHFPPTAPHFASNTSQPSQSTNPIHPSAIGLLPSSMTSPAPPSTPTSMLHTDITATTVDFLNSACMEVTLLGMVSQWPQDIAQWQQGCAALMRWVKMRLRSGAFEPRDSVIGTGPTSVSTGRSGDSLGELLDGVVGVLEKVMGRGWDGWGV